MPCQFNFQSQGQFLRPTALLKTPAAFQAHARYPGPAAQVKGKSPSPGPFANPRDLTREHGNIKEYKDFYAPCRQGRNPWGQKPIPLLFPPPASRA